MAILKNHISTFGDLAKISTSTFGDIRSSALIDVASFQYILELFGEIFNKNMLNSFDRSLAPTKCHHLAKFCQIKKHCARVVGANSVEVWNGH